MSLVVEQIQIMRGDFRLSVPFLEVRAGELVCLMGKSGSGKSTLIDAVAGFVSPVSGKIFSAGVEIQELPPESRKIAVLFQQPALFESMRVRENVAFGLRVQGVGRAEREKRARDWLARLEIETLEERLPKTLSGGQAQRVAMARAFIVGFPSLLLDEPFAALDTALRSQMRGLLKKLVKETGTACLMVTHDPLDAEVLGDRVVILDAGTVVQEGTFRELKERPASVVVSELLGN